MRCIPWLLVVALIVNLTSAARRPNQPITSCPSPCVCESIFCKSTQRRGKIFCAGVAASCFHANLTSFPPGVVANVTGLLLSNNSMTTINFDEFSNLAKLETLLVDNNLIRDIIINSRFKKLRRLSFKNNKIFHLPQRGFKLLKNLVDLNLEMNRITSVQGIKFPHKLRTLNLNHNRIRTLTSGSFRKLKELQTLKLEYNVIDFISKTTFIQATQLNVLYLSNNNLRILGENQFQQLPMCWFISLAGNNIHEVHPYAFRLFGVKNNNHHQIHLESNALRFIEEDMLGLFMSEVRRVLYSFYFAGNPIFCDCNIQLLRDDAGSLLRDPHKMVCDSPRNLNHTTLAELNIEECCV
nr:leucine-rich repeat-containing protein 70-like [Ciona intestinalis]|eukprot:XP_002121005.1 leucine-rich repeat-containing protein 70-like [Ciona intestinalis]